MYKAIPLQETYDTIVNHLRKQGKPAKNEAQDCKYRMIDEAGNQLKCAAGCLIPDDIYDESFEGETLIGMNPTKIGYIIQGLGHNIDLVQDLQSVHDSWNSGYHWEDNRPIEDKFIEIAKKFNLEYKNTCTIKAILE